MKSPAKICHGFGNCDEHDASSSTAFMRTRLPVAAVSSNFIKFDFELNDAIMRNFNVFVSNCEIDIFVEVLKMMNIFDWFQIEDKLFQVIRIEEEDIVCFELIVQEPQNVMLLNNMKGVSLQSGDKNDCKPER